jgi:hypothetical protein
MKNLVNRSQDDRYALAESLGEAFGYEGDTQIHHERMTRKFQQRLRDLTYEADSKRHK